MNQALGKVKGVFFLNTFMGIRSNSTILFLTLSHSPNCGVVLGEHDCFKNNSIDFPLNLTKLKETYCVGNSQFAPIRKPSEFARSHPASQRAVYTCELGALQRSDAMALCVGNSQFAPIRNHLLFAHSHTHSQTRSLRISQHSAHTCLPSKATRVLCKRSSAATRSWRSSSRC